MIEITNKLKSPIQVLVRSKTTPRGFTCLNIPGVGANKNTVVIEDEMATEYIKRIENLKLITTRYIK